MRIDFSMKSVVFKKQSMTGLIIATENCKMILTKYPDNITKFKKVRRTKLLKLHLWRFPTRK